MPKNSLLGFSIMFISALAYGAGDILVKVIGENLSPWQVTSGRAVIGLSAAVIWARFNLRAFIIPDWPWQVAIGLSSSVAYVCMLFAIKKLPLSISMPLIYLYPALGALLSPLINKEKPSWAEWLAIGLAFLGICFLAHGAAGEDSADWGGVAWALSGAFWMGLMANLSRRQAKARPLYVVIFYLFLINFLFCLPVSFLTDKPFIPVGRDFVNLALIISPTIACGALLMIVGFKYLSAHCGSVVLTLEAVVASLFGLIFLHEPLTLAIGVGGGLLIASAFIIAASGK